MSALPGSQMEQKDISETLWVVSERNKSDLDLVYNRKAITN